MSFTPNIPASGNSLGQTRDPIRNNFTNYNTVISQDHVAPNDDDQGKHKFSTYVEQGADPDPDANECAVYSKEAASVTELFFQRESAGTAIQMTVGDPTAATQGQTFLPGGVIVKWDTITMTANNQEVTFPSAFPNACFGVLAINQGNGSNTAYMSISTKSVSSFFLLANSIAVGFPFGVFYVAIGN